MGKYVVLVDVDGEITGVFGLFDSEAAAMSWSTTKSSQGWKALFKIVDLSSP